MTAREQLQRHSDRLIEQNKMRRPRGWNRMSETQRLDFIATRMLAESRTTTSHTEMKEEGYLSVSQQERRRRREVYGSMTFDQLPPTRGVFGRKYAGK